MRSPSDFIHSNLALRISSTPSAPRPSSTLIDFAKTGEVRGDPPGSSTLSVLVRESRTVPFQTHNPKQNKKTKQNNKQKRKTKTKTQNKKLKTKQKQNTKTKTKTKNKTKSKTTTKNNSIPTSNTTARPPAHGRHPRAQQSISTNSRSTAHGGR